MIAALMLVCCLAAPAEVTVETEEISLGSLIPFPAGDARAAIPLGYAPQPGVARRFFKHELLHKIGAAGLETGDLDLPDSVLVWRKARHLDTERVRILIQAAFTREYPGAVVNVKSVEVPQTQVGTGELDLVASIPARADISKPVFVRVDVKGAGFSRNIYVKTVAELLKEQPVLKTAAPANSTIQREDVEWQVVPVRGVAPPIDDLRLLEGALASHDLAAGQVLTADMLYSPLMVRRGEPVTVKVSAGGIAIAATMRAKSDARFGETIVVEHISGTGSASARVIGPRTLEALEGVR